MKRMISFLDEVLSGFGFFQSKFGVLFCCLSFCDSLLFNAMGISVSNSDNQKQVQKVREHKILKRKQMIAGELQKSISEMHQGSALKENNQQNSPSKPVSTRRLTKNSKAEHSESKNVVSIGQKKGQNNDSKIEQRGKLHFSKSNNSLSNSEPIYQEKQAAHIKHSNEKTLMKSTKKVEYHPDLAEQMRKEPQPQRMEPDIKASRESNLRASKESAVADLKRTQNKSWRGPQNQQQFEADNISTQKKPIQFNQFDWSIPTDGDQQDMVKKKAILPSMNLVLSNKFAESLSYIRQEEDEQLAARNRRQIMRELLTGKRNSADDAFIMPTCNFKSLEVPRMCQQK